MEIWHPFVQLFKAIVKIVANSRETNERKKERQKRRNTTNLLQRGRAESFTLDADKSASRQLHCVDGGLKIERIKGIGR
jgi:hypothetical protein